MVSRREMLTGGTLAGLVGAVAPTDTRQTGQQDFDLAPITHALNAIRDEIRRDRDPASLAVSRDVIGQLRRAQKQHFRTNTRFPAWIEVGIDVFECVYDWHIRNLQPITMGRDSSGRYTITFFFTTLILRADVEPNYISMPYDER